MHTLTRTAAAAALMTSVAFSPACGGSGDDESSDLITVDEGGSIEIEGTDTRIDIPANALGEDTEITISLAELGDFAALDNARNSVLVIAPDGLVLSAPATITLDPGEPAVTGDQLLSIRQFRSGVDGGWVSPEVSAAELHSGGLVSASIIQFAPIALVVKDAPVESGTVAGTVLHIYTEAPLSGITFELEQGDSVIDTTVSDADGMFGFSEVAVGTYNVHADVSADENCYSDPVDKDAVVTDQNTTNVFFGFVPGPC
jgi:hypothetical protein